MGIRKKEGCNLNVTVLFALFLCVSGVASLPKSLACPPAWLQKQSAWGYLMVEDRQRTAEALINSYNIGDKVTETEAEQVASILEKALTKCESSYLAFRVKYRIAVVYFKAQMLDKALDRFMEVSNTPDCPELIGASSLNMAGQILRMKGDYRKALDVFGNLAGTFKGKPGRGHSKAVRLGMPYGGKPVVMKLKCLAMFAKGEIRQLQGSYTAAIKEYERLLNFLRQDKNNKLEKYIPVVKDRVSQLYLKCGDINKYLRTAGEFTADYPEYYRTGIIKFEIECVRFLKNVRQNKQFSIDSFAAPAELIGYLKDAKDTASMQIFAKMLERLCEKHSDTYSSVLLSYHYAWLLDAMGQKDRSVKLLSQISSTDVKDIDESSQLKSIINTVSKYAVIQRAIMLSENGDYNQSLRMLSDLQLDAGESYMSSLVKSVMKSLRILKKEGVKNETK